MRCVSLLLIGFLCFFSTYAAQEPPKKLSRLRALMSRLTINPDLRATALKKSSPASTSSPQIKRMVSHGSLGTPETPHAFSADSVLKKLALNIESLSSSITRGGGTAFAEKRDEFLEYERYKLAKDLDAVAKRYVKNGSICDGLAQIYGDNELLKPHDAFLNVEELFPYVIKIAPRYKVTITNRTDAMKLLEISKNIANDFMLPPAKRRNLQQVFDILLSEQEAENYRLFLVNCLFEDLKFNLKQYEKLTELQQQYQQIVHQL